MALGFKIFTVAEALSKAFRENTDKQSGQISTIIKDSNGNEINIADATITYTQAIENDEQGKAIFIGLATPGSAKSAAAWQIRKITYDGNSAATDIQFANSSNAFDQIWNDRAGLSYG